MNTVMDTTNVAILKMELREAKRYEVKLWRGGLPLDHHLYVATKNEISRLEDAIERDVQQRQLALSQVLEAEREKSN